MMTSVRQTTDKGLRSATAALLFLLAVQGLSVTIAAADEQDTPARETAQPYRIQPGDVLIISVWKEKDLQGEVLVQPDGGLSFPLVGEIQASDKSIEELRTAITAKLEHYIPSPVVTVAVRTIGGNRIYVLGKVNRPGEYPFGKPLDVMQALSLAGGTASFAEVNDIIVLRRDTHGQQEAIRFRYAEVEHGRELAQNILLRSGDTVVVP